MQILMTTQPGHGHLNPMLPIAAALQVAGHHVRFAVAASFIPTIQRHGFEAVAAGVDYLESQVEDTFPEVAAMSDAERSEWFIADLFGDMAATQMAADLTEICHVWRPDLIVRGAFEFGACVVAEKFNIPHVAINVGLFHSPQILAGAIAEQMAFLRMLHGLSAQPALEMLYRHLYLSNLPRRFEHPDVMLPVGYRPFQPQFKAPAQATLPDYIHTLPDQPTVHVTLGTVFNNRPAVYQLIIEALREEPLNLIVAIGKGQDVTQFGPQPANVYIENFISHALLLPYCDLVIGHGGSGTTLHAMAEGLPQLVVPLSAEQPYVANRVTDLQVGKALYLPGSFTPEQLTAVMAQWPLVTHESVRSSTLELLHNPQYRHNARQIQQELMNNATPRKIVSELEKLVHHQPERCAAPESLVENYRSG